MRIVYRMRGLLGDATEEFIESLDSTTGTALPQITAAGWIRGLAPVSSSVLGPGGVLGRCCLVRLVRIEGRLLLQLRKKTGVYGLIQILLGLGRKKTNLGGKNAN